MMLTAVSNSLHTAMDSGEFLSQAITILGTSDDFPATINDLARLANSSISDWCAIFTFENESSMRRLVPMEGLFPMDFHAAYGPGYVLRTGESQFLREISSEVVASIGFRLGDPPFDEGRRPSACLSLPVIARGRTIGSIALLTARSNGSLTGSHLPLAKAVANAAAVAIDRAELHRKAQEANRLKDEFVAMVSHELRTPLTPILGGVHLLRNAELSRANFDRALQMIERNAEAQVQIVEDLLDVSRIVAGKLHLAMKSVQLIPVLEAAVQSVQLAAEGKGVTIVTNFEEMQHPIDGDANRLQQIVRHLLSNAVKFTPADGKIEVLLKADGDHALIQVTDTGIGIPAYVLPHIFDRSRQASDAGAKLRSGLGLGLSIVRHLVELHNGTIEAASPGRDRDQGAVFTVRFPSAARRAIAVGNSGTDT
jgi:signal transduction histidine kinase